MNASGGVVGLGALQQQGCVGMDGVDASVDAGSQVLQGAV
jgi:hypothetical protein